MVLPKRIELLTSPLPRECSTTELRQQAALRFRGAPMNKRCGPVKGERSICRKWQKKMMSAQNVWLRR
jgi:hypothetical protein